MAGGGGASGAYMFPYESSGDTPTSFYSHWIRDLDALFTATWAASTPYTGETAPDPDDYMDDSTATRTQHRLNLHAADVDALNARTDFGNYVDDAVAKADASGVFPAVEVGTSIEAVHVSERGSITSMMDAAMDAAADAVEGSALSSLVDAYERTIRKTFLRAQSRFAAGMADINAVNSSAFIFGMALIERQLVEELNKFSAEQGQNVFNAYVTTFANTFKDHTAAYMQLNQSRQNNRDKFISSGITDLVSLISHTIASSSELTKLQTDVNKMRLVAEIDEQQEQIQLDEAEALWDYRVFQYGGNMLSSSGGAAVLPQKMSIFQSVLSGVATGVGIGASITKPF